MKSIIKKFKEHQKKKKDLDLEIKKKQDECPEHQFISVPVKISYKQHENIIQFLYGGAKVIEIDTVVHICTKCDKEIYVEVNV